MASMGSKDVPFTGSPLDSLFVLRHAQRADKVSTTVSSIDFVQKTHHRQNEYVISDSYNPGLATFQSTSNKSNNGYTQSMEMGQKILSYVQTHIKENLVVLKFHTSPYLRCIQTIKFMIDYITKKHKDSSKQIKIIIHIDHFLSEWLNSDLDIDHYPPNDNGESLLSFAIQYLNSNLNLSSRNELVDVRLDLSDSYKFGNPGPYSESFIQQYNRLNQGLISLIKDSCSNVITESTDQKEILLIMTHGAVVRSLISKLIGKSLFVEIPLGSMSIAKPMSDYQKSKYLWKLLETDIEIKSNITFNTINILSNSDPFQDVQLTFNNNLSSQLNFKTEINSERRTSSRLRSQSLFSPKYGPQDDSEDSEDSDNEGITFNATRRRPKTTIPTDPNAEDQKRFRSSSLFGPVLRNPFFSDDESSLPRRQRKANTKNNIYNNGFSIKTPQPIKKSTLSLNDDEYINPTDKPDHLYQNVDVDDGSNVEYVPDLEELSSSNSSSNSLNDSINHLTIFPGSFSTLNNSNSLPERDNTDSITPIASSYELSKSNNSSIITLDGAGSNQNLHATKSQGSFVGTSANAYNNNNSKSSIFDKSLIEKSLNEILTPLTENLERPTTDNNNTNVNTNTEPPVNKKKQPLSILQDHSEADSSNWMMSFGDSSSSKSTTSEASNTNKFKIDLYGKKNRFGLNLYDDIDEQEEDNYGGFGSGFANNFNRNSGWLLGSNKY